MNEKTAQFDSHCDALQALHAITKCSLQLAACSLWQTLHHAAPNTPRRCCCVVAVAAFSQLRGNLQTHKSGGR